jgi:hypothetical protein
MQLQANVNEFVEDLATVPFLDGVTVSAQVAATDTIIPHTLNRQPQGWFITDIDAAATVYRAAWNTRTITLHASAPVNIQLWVF